MDYYQSDRPPVDDSGLSGGVLFKLGAQIASTQSFKAETGSNAQPPSFNDGGQQKYTLQICVNGTPMNLDVMVGSGTQQYSI